MRRGNLTDAHYRKRGNRSFMNGSKMLTFGRDIAGMCVGHIGYVFTYPAFKVKCEVCPTYCTLHVSLFITFITLLLLQLIYCNMSYLLPLVKEVITLDFFRTEQQIHTLWPQQYDLLIPQKSISQQYVYSHYKILPQIIFIFSKILKMFTNCYISCKLINVQNHP